ncbi:MAG: hypothetical protein JWP42_624 [Pseudomonas sp.]|nr:hypothetical protein [Pseudomonas sp.]
MREAAILTAVGQGRVAIAIPGVVHDHSRGLHQRVANGRADERESGFFQAFAHLHRNRRDGRHFGAILEVIDLRNTTNEGPEKRHRVLQRQPCLGIAPCRVEFETVADDPRIEHQFVDFGVAHLRHALYVKAEQHLAITLTFAQHSDP